MAIHSSITDTNGVTHPWVWDFELTLFDRNKLFAIEKLTHDWWWLSIPYALLYIVAIFIGQAWMAKREKFELRKPLVVWNIFLCVFSFWGACRCVLELLHGLIHHGFRHSICDASFKEGVTGVWSWLFAFSKLPETIDTLFIVLRRQPLIFLHWYHHATVLIYCAYSYAYFISTGRWFGSMNFIVHAIMYGYFACRAARVRLPRWIQPLITSLQLMQMVVGCIVNIAAYDQKQKGHSCATSFLNIKISLAMYVSYFVLFAHLFYTNYFHKSSEKRSKEKKSE